MANVYYKIDDSKCYYTNENKEGYILRTDAAQVTYDVQIIIELYNDKFILPENSSYLFYRCTNTTFNDIDKWDTSNVTDNKGG